MIILTASSLFGLFLLWTLIAYFMHRIAHFRHRLNPLYYIHLAHHKINYLTEDRKFKWYYLLFYFGSIRETLDILLILTLPAIFLFALFPRLGIYLLAYHYLYEAFLSEGLLDHNPRIHGKVTKFFSWGEYHLTHHRTWKYNYSLMITLWDHVFGTLKKDKEEPKV